MDLLVFGKSGQIGYELVIQQGSSTSIVALGRKDVDLTNPHSVREAIRANKPAVIVNAAAYTAVDKAESDKDTAFAVNADAPRTMAEEARVLGALLVHFSTDYVYSGDKGSPYLEDDATCPASTYGESKLAGDEAIQTSGCDHLIFRTSWVFGDRGNNFVRTMLRLGAEREQLRVVDDQRGCPSEASELARGSAKAFRRIMTMSASERAARSGVYHLTCSGEATWFGFAKEIFRRSRELEIPLKIKDLVPISTAEYPTTAARPAYSVLSNEKYIHTFGEGMPSWRDALANTLTRIKQEKQLPE